MKTAEEILNPMWNEWKDNKMSFYQIALKAMDIYAKQVATNTIESVASRLYTSGCPLTNEDYQTITHTPIRTP